MPYRPSQAQNHHLGARRLSAPNDYHHSGSVR
jgi:hypothetical protein